MSEKKKKISTKNYYLEDA